jgi:hypothetical protein
MDAIMSKVVQINLTGQEVQDMLMHKIYAKYPDLADDTKWCWEDFSLSFNSQKLEAGALNIIFTQNSDYCEDSKETTNTPITFVEGGGI